MRVALGILLIISLAWAPAGAHAQERPAPASPTVDSADELIYIDAGGYIRVYDQVTQAGQLPVAWVSPTGGWRDATLADFNDDGDAEVVATGGQGSTSQLVVYDPVVAAGIVDPNQQFNNYYWDTLYTLALPATPRLLTTGEFDPTTPGHEIVVVHELSGEAGLGERATRTVILTQGIPAPDGRSWQLLAELATPTPWTDVAAGDIEFNGRDNLVLIDEEDSLLTIYRLLGASLVPYFVDQSGSKEWNHAVVGQVDATTPQPELVLVRNVERPLPSLIVWRYDGNDTFADVFLRAIFPSPRFVFLANTTGALASGASDFEMFLMRNTYRTTECVSPFNQLTMQPFQLLMRNRGEDSHILFEICLDKDNLFRYGAGGDLDGDAKDEIAVISPGILRIFNSPDTSTSEITELAISSNGRTLAAGDLDRNGSAQPDRLNARPSSRFVFVVPAGDTAETDFTQIENLTNDRALPIYVRVPTYAPYLRWVLSDTQTTTRLTVIADASELLPDGIYGANLQVVSGRDRVADSPLTIPVLVQTTPGLLLRPAGRTVVVSPCVPPVSPLTVTLGVAGSASITFTGRVEPHATAADNISSAAVEWPIYGVPWITSATTVNAPSPLSATVPSSITLTLDVAQATGFDQADVVVDAFVLDLGRTVERRATVNLVCTEHVAYLPWVGR